MLLSCEQLPREQGTNLQQTRNDTVYFPPQPFDAVYAYQFEDSGFTDLPALLGPDGHLHPRVQQPGKLLVPAHRADLAVALALNEGPFASQSCEAIDYALVWFKDTDPVAALGISFSCGFRRFEPPAAFMMREGNMDRLRLIFSELGYLAE